MTATTKFTAMDKFLYNLREIAAEGDEHGNMKLVPMRKAVFVDYVLGLIQVTLIAAAFYLWIPGICGMFFLFDYTPVHTFISVANMIAMALVWDLWGGLKFGKNDKIEAPTK